MKQPLSAYRGDGPYVFVCYAHEDADAVYREIAWLSDYGVNVWYDEGISPGHEWREELATAIQSCTKVLYFVTPNSVVSEHCRRELNFAQEENREVVAIHLEPTEMPAGLRLGLNNRQAIHKHELSDEEYRKRLIRVAHEGASAPSQASDRPVSAASKRGLGIAVLVVALLIVAGAVWQLAPQNVPAGNSVAEPVAETAVGASSGVLHNSIAVLPFDNLSPDPDNAYFAAGIHEEILNQLVKIKDLSVIARTSVMQYAGAHRPIVEIANELKVNTVMEGSVRYAGNRVRITAQLIDATSGAHLWSEAFEDDLADIFGIQLAIATRIAEALEAEFSPAERQSVGTRITDSPEAYAHYLRAVSIYGSFRPTQPVHDALDAALALDPEFDTALAFKAFIYSVESFAGPVVNMPSWDPNAVRRLSTLADDYARRALALNSEQSRAHHAMSIVHQGRREWQAALESAERAYALNPNDYLIATWLGRLYAVPGNEQDGLALFRRALALNPNDMIIVYTFGLMLEEAGHWEEAMEQLRMVTAVAPDFVMGHMNLGESAYYAGDLETTRHTAATLESEDYEVEGLVGSTHLYGLLGDMDAARRVFDLAVAHPQYDTLLPVNKFHLHSAVHNQDQAMVILERMVEDNFPPAFMVLLHYFPASHFFDSVRSDPRFDKLLKRVARPVEG